MAAKHFQPGALLAPDVRRRNSIHRLKASSVWSGKAANAWRATPWSTTGSGLAIANRAIHALAPSSRRSPVSVTAIG